MQLGESLEDFFDGQLDEALRAEGLPPAGPTKPYLVRLLAAYAAQPIEDRPLGLRLLQAQEVSPRERRSRLREIGDTSLFLSGFWGDSLGGKLVDVDYYIELGGMAYRALARELGCDPDRASERHREASPSEIFAELASQFSRFVGVLMTVRHRTAARGASARDIVRLYDRWMRTKSGWAARRLVEEGVIATDQRRGTLH